jgi:hypothetical protein
MSERECKKVIQKENLPPLLALSVRAERADHSALPDTSGKVRGTATAPATRGPIDKYHEVLTRLWLLNVSDDRPFPHTHDADIADARRLLAEQARLCAELGADFAAVVRRQAAREWARRMLRCPWCGLAGVRHDVDSGEPIALP